MSGLEDIDDLLHPRLLTSLKGELPPVVCKIWRHGDTYETIELTSLYPFDTLDTIKYAISAQKEGQNKYLYNTLFVGIPKTGDTSSFLPLDYLWYAAGTSDASKVISLPRPTKALLEGVKSFTTRSGRKPNLATQPRGRSTIEMMFQLDAGGTIPELYVYTLEDLLSKRTASSAISEADWYSRFYPYFPAIEPEGPYEATDEDIAFGKEVIAYLKRRETHIENIEAILTSGGGLPELKVTGVQQLRLELSKPFSKASSCEQLFYSAPVTKERPYMRFLPGDGTPVTKVHVRGALPIPTLEDPEVLLQWAKDTTPTLGRDCLIVKYVHRSGELSSCPIYGTIRVFDDETADLLLQTPKHVRKLDPIYDFRTFKATLTKALDKFPFLPESFDLGEIALTFQLQIGSRDPPFTKERLRERIPFFSTFFQEIAPIKDRQTLLSLRYKAVSQYATESNISSYITQYVTQKGLDGEEDIINHGTVEELQEEFQLTEGQARAAITDWLKRDVTFTPVVPEENEFIENENPGIDIHIYPQHPFYSFHVHRIDSYQAFQRIYTLLALMFVPDDALFETNPRGEAAFNRLGAAVEAESLLREVRGTVTPVAPLSASARRFGEEEEEEGEEEEGVSYTPAATTATTVAAAKKPSKGEAPTVNPSSWFLNKLKETDSDLFDYTPLKPNKGYARQCAANNDQNPSVLTQDRFDRMVEEYDEEIQKGELFFDVLPITGDENHTPPYGAEVITVMRYGTNRDRQNYYFCPELFCLYDEIMVLSKDFEATKDRNNKGKVANTCPFCGGGVIPLVEGKRGDERKLTKGKTVIRRRPKDIDNPHLYIGFLKSTWHPEKYHLPCCYTKASTNMRITDPEFGHLRSILLKRGESTVLPTQVVREGELEEEEDEEGKRIEELELQAYKNIIVNYALELQKIGMPTTYILEVEKHPLPPGKFGIVPFPFDEYFAQNSKRIVTKVVQNNRLAPSCRGFLRLGTEIGPLDAKCGNKVKPTESLLGVLAPLLNRRSIQEVRERFQELLKTAKTGVPLFVNANFGNLVNEFYNPTNVIPGKVSDVDNLVDPAQAPNWSPALKKWASDNLNISINQANEFAVKRIYKSYHNFLAFLEDPSQPKEMRHFTSFLAEPNLLRANIRGLQIIVLEWAPPKSRDEPVKQVQVRCAPYGFSMDRHQDNDFAFVWRDDDGFYELLFYVKNTPAKGPQGAKTEPIVRWESMNRGTWPQIIKDRVNEYMQQCQSDYRSIYTPQTGVDSMAMVPLSNAIKSIDRMVKGVVRDSYNHAAFILFPITSGSISESTRYAALPVVDDGYIPHNVQLFLDIEDFKAAPADDLIDYYAKYFAPIFSMYPGYNVASVVRDAANRVVAIQLANGLFVPASKPRDEGKLDAFAKVNTEELEWRINRELSKPCGSSSFKDTTMKKMGELYQHLRYMFSEWLASKDAGSEIRTDIEEIVFDDDLPEYEKRKRLEILLSPVLTTWMMPDPEKWDMPHGFLRKDCRVLKEGECNGACAWRAGEGTCALHVDETMEMDSTGRKVNTVTVFSRRLIDELIRFPGRRRELIRQGVSKMGALADPIRIGDQYIIPEQGTSWINMLRLDWQEPTDKPKYYEEMADTARAKEGKVKGVAARLPAALEAIVGTEVDYKVWMAPRGLSGLSGILGVPMADLGVTEGVTKLSATGLQEYVKLMKRAIGAIDLTGGKPMVEFVRIGGGVQSTAVVLLYMPEGVGLLIEKTGNPTISTDMFQGQMLEAWTLAPRVDTQETGLKRRGRAGPAIDLSALQNESNEESSPETPVIRSTVLKKANQTSVAPSGKSILGQRRSTAQALAEEAPAEEEALAEEGAPIEEATPAEEAAAEEAPAAEALAEEGAPAEEAAAEEAPAEEGAPAEEASAEEAPAEEAPAAQVLAEETPAEEEAPAEEASAEEEAPEEAPAAQVLAGEESPEEAPAEEESAEEEGSPPPFNFLKQASSAPVYQESSSAKSSSAESSPNSPVNFLKQAKTTSNYNEGSNEEEESSSAEESSPESALNILQKLRQQSSEEEEEEEEEEAPPVNIKQYRANVLKRVQAAALPAPSPKSTTIKFGSNEVRELSSGNNAKTKTPVPSPTRLPRKSILKKK